MVELKIVGLKVAPDNTKVLLLQEKESATEEARILPIFIGDFEASAIAMALSDHEPPRPQTHDLLKFVMEEVKAEITSVTITDIEDRTYFAEMELRAADGKASVISCRPSDAIAMAVRMNIPIFSLEEVLESSAFTLADISGGMSGGEEGEEVSEEQQEEEIEKFKDFIDNVNPEDFK